MKVIATKERVVVSMSEREATSLRDILTDYRRLVKRDFRGAQVMRNKTRTLRNNLSKAISKIR
jgi:hypothetical protein